MGYIFDLSNISIRIFKYGSQKIHKGWTLILFSSCWWTCYWFDISEEEKQNIHPPEIISKNCIKRDFTKIIFWTRHLLMLSLNSTFSFNIDLNIIVDCWPEMLFLIQFPCKLWKSSLKRTCFKQNFNSWTFSNFFSNYYVKILMRYNIQNKILDRKIALFVFKLREQLFELREEYRKNDIEWFFFIKLSLGKLLGKDNVGGNEALRVNLLSNTQTRLK